MTNQYSSYHEGELAVQTRAGVGAEGLPAEALSSRAIRRPCRNSHERLHQNFIRATHNRVLHLLKIVLDLVKPVHALLEMTRQAGE
jgi:hypothetical protein